MFYSTMFYRPDDKKYKFLAEKKIIRTRKKNYRTSMFLFLQVLYATEKRCLDRTASLSERKKKRIGPRLADLGI